MTVYEQLGGVDGVSAAVDAFYERMLADERLGAWFHQIPMPQLKAHQRAFLTVALGGPEAYDGRSMRNAHAGLGITQEDYTRAVDHLAAALAEVGVDDTVILVVRRRIELMRAAIVEVR